MKRKLLLIALGCLLVLSMILTSCSSMVSQNLSKGDMAALDGFTNAEMGFAGAMIEADMEAYYPEGFNTEEYFAGVFLFFGKKVFCELSVSA